MGTHLLSLKSNLQRDPEAAENYDCAFFESNHFSPQNKLVSLLYNSRV